MRWYAFRLWLWDVARLRFGDYHWEGRNRALYHRRTRDRSPSTRPG